MAGPYFVRASDIITHLRAMFKNDVQEKTLVDINKLVSSVLALARIDLQKHKIELQAQLDDRFPKVLSNQVQLQQVILNLVMNAIEAMSSSQTRVLRIKTELSQSNKVHVSIEDTGTGIKPSDVARVFQPMFTTKARCMGMGLSICQSIIENHDGRIWVSPRANGGSIFQFELPWQPARLKQPELVQSGRSRRFQGNSGDDTDINGRPLLALSGHRLVRCTCLLLTQSGHLRPFTRPFNPRFLHGTMLCATRGGYNEAARVHQACWWGGYLAACSERATASYACHRVHERTLT